MNVIESRSASVSVSRRHHPINSRTLSASSTDEFDYSFDDDLDEQPLHSVPLAAELRQQPLDPILKHAVPSSIHRSTPVSSYIAPSRKSSTANLIRSSQPQPHTNLASTSLLQSPAESDHISNQPHLSAAFRSSSPLPPLLMSSRSESDELELKHAGGARPSTYDDPDLPTSHPDPIIAKGGPAAPSELPLPLPISPGALLQYVRHMRLASKNRKAGVNSDGPLKLPLHNRASSSTSAISDEALSHSLHSLQLSTAQTASENPSSDLVHSSQPRSLTIPDGAAQDDTKPVAETLDLSHRRIADITQPVVEELAEYVERLALGYNYLPVLPDHFAFLGESLRYLNLRGNHMEIFPEVLTRMPSLEILDVSRNKIKAFPRRPGTLDRLRVLSVSRNRLRRLPNYVAYLTTLRVLKLDHNPVVWPPRDLITFTDASAPADDDDVDPQMRFQEESTARTRTRTASSSETSTAMAHWLRVLQEWMRQNPYVRPVKVVRPSTGDPSTEHKPTELRVKTISPSCRINSAEESPLTIENVLSGLPSNKFEVEPRPTPPTQHNRNASSGSSSQWVRKRPDLRLKKSLPDLRRNHGEIMVERRADADRSYSGLIRTNTAHAPNSSASATFILKPSSLNDRGPHSALPTSGERHLPLPELSTEVVTPASPAVHFKHSDLITHDRVHPRRLKLGSHTGDDRLAGDRNSGAYFRRLSMLPPSTISKEVPVPLLKLMDAIRGILFSLSQIYAALKQFVVFATQDRLPGALSRMMSTADDSMSRLINSLDRFDSLTRRSQPEGEVVREVLLCCRDNVAIFGKLVNVLSIQLKVLTGSADVRYSRTLLLTLYGATAEIAMSWSAITPLVDVVVSLAKLRNPTSISIDVSHPKPNDRVESHYSSPHLELHPLDSIITNSDVQSLKTDGPPEATRSFQSPSSTSFTGGLTRSTALSSSLSAAGTVRQKGRRHAGSFSVEDVQLGAILPPASAGLSSTFPPILSSTNSPASHAATLSPGVPLEPGRLRSESSGFHPLPDPTHPNGRHPRERSGTTRPNGSSSGLSLPLLTIGERETEMGGQSSPLPLIPGSSTTRSFIPGHSESGLGSTARQTENRPSLLDEPLSPDPSDVKSQSRASVTEPSQYSVSYSQSTHSSLATSASDVPEHLVLVERRASMDPALSRTDQDFLDMAEATINIAVSVSSMMLENLGQAMTSTDTRGGMADHVFIDDVRRPHEHELEGAVRHDRSRQGESTHVKLTKAIELKELCEIEMEIIKQLRVSLDQFWTSRHGPEDRGELGDETNEGRIGQASEKNGRVRGQETRRVYEDATAFVKAVIQTAHLARATLTEYPLSKAIREGLGELTKATKELATLLAVSSFKPGSTTSAPSSTMSIPSALYHSTGSTTSSSTTPISPAITNTDSSIIESV